MLKQPDEGAGKEPRRVSQLAQPPLPLSPGTKKRPSTGIVLQARTARSARAAWAPVRWE